MTDPEQSIPARRFFIVGTGRCGTTLFRKLLTLHPDVHVPRETHWLPILYHSFGLGKASPERMLDLVEQVYMAKGKTALWRILNDHDLSVPDFRERWLTKLAGASTASIAELMNAFYDLIAELSGASVIGDKTPDYGLCMGTLQSIWPEARFIHFYRDGRDVALSMSQVLSFRLLAAWGVNHWWALAYRRQYEAMLDEARAEQPLEKLFELWRERLVRTRDEASRLKPGTCMEMSYESLLADPHACLNEVGGFLDLPPGGDWVDAAAAMIRRDNAGKNRDLPEYEALTRQFAGELRTLGFEA